MFSVPSLACWISCPLLSSTLLFWEEVSVCLTFWFIFDPFLMESFLTCSWPVPNVSDFWSVWLCLPLLNVEFQSVWPRTHSLLVSILCAVCSQSLRPIFRWSVGALCSCAVARQSPNPGSTLSVYPPFDNSSECFWLYSVLVAVSLDAQIVY